MQWWSGRVLPLWDGGGNYGNYQSCIANEDDRHGTFIGLCSTLLPTCNLKMVGSYVSYHIKQIIETSGVHVEHHINRDSHQVPIVSYSIS